MRSIYSKMIKEKLMPNLNPLNKKQEFSDIARESISKYLVPRKS